MVLMGKIYSFSNENLTSYESIYNFTDAKVLSVLGSGDHYFSSVLYGAKEVDVFDINPLTRDFFQLKFNALKKLDYYSFYDIFVHYKLTPPPGYEKQIDLITDGKGIPINIILNMIYDDTLHLSYEDGSSIPYLDYDKYYLLQEKLQKTEMPNFHCIDFKKLNTVIAKNYYDLLLTSNIHQWINIHIPYDVDSYKAYLESFGCSEVQAMYSWHMTEYAKMLLHEKGLIIQDVDSSRKKSNGKDTIVSLKRVK